LDGQGFNRLFSTEGKKIFPADYVRAFIFPYETKKKKKKKKKKKRNKERNKTKHF